MKSLYNILGLDQAASTTQIEEAYNTYLAKLQSGAYGLSEEETRNQAIAVQEAYNTLSNPILRQRYDQKLAAENSANTPTFDSSSYYEATSSGFFSTKTIILIGLFVLAGIYLYVSNQKESERLRIEHEHEIQMKTVQIEEDRQKQNARIQDVVIDKASSYAEQRQSLATQQQFEREIAQQQREEQRRQQMEEMQRQRQQQQQQWEETNRQRQAQMQAQRQQQADKRLLQQYERDHYGKVITY